MKKLILGTIVTLFFIVAVTSIFSIKAESRKSYISNNNKAEEAAYLKEVKTVLSDYYVKNAGLTLTKTSEDGTVTEYNLEIHTGRENSEEMIEKIKRLSPNVPGCTVRVNFS